MRDLGITGEDVASWFAGEHREQFALVRVPGAAASAWHDVLGLVVRRAYISDEALRQRALDTERPESDILAAKLPDPGSTMAGDFGEILVFLFHATEHPNTDLIGPKKWRLKQDRTKPAPYSDVVQFIVPQWPQPSEDDRILCSEVKTKSTDGASTPISSAIADSEKDRTSRLTKTLLWLRDRALLTRPAFS